jgi:WD40 repeat protein
VLFILSLPNGNLASSSEDMSIRVWNVTTGLSIRTLNGHQLNVVNCLLSLDSELIASGERDSLIKIWNPETSRLVTFIPGHAEQVTSLINLKKYHMASSSTDRTVKIWNYQRLEYGVALLATFRGHTNGVTRLCLVYDDRYLLSASVDATVKMWNLNAIYNYPPRSNLIAAVDD